MKRSTVDWFMRVRRRALRSSGVSDVVPVGGDLSVCGSGGVAVGLRPAASPCVSMAAVRARASAPTMRESSVWPRSTIKEGTLSISNDSEISSFVGLGFYEEGEQRWVLPRKFTSPQNKQVLGHLLAWLGPRRLRV